MIAPEGTTVYFDDPSSGAMSEAFTAGGVTTFRDYIKADGVIVAVRSAQGSNVTLSDGARIFGDGAFWTSSVTQAGRR